jgi:hypothetical protein
MKMENILKAGHFEIYGEGKTIKIVFRMDYKPADITIKDENTYTMNEIKRLLTSKHILVFAETEEEQT